MAGSNFRSIFELHCWLLDYTIDNEWPSQEEEQHDWMRQQDWVPCDCAAFFFCLNVLTNGIDNTKKGNNEFIYHGNTWTTPDGCTDKQVNPVRGCEYVRMCYRKLCKGTPDKWAISSNRKVSVAPQEWVVLHVITYLQKLPSQGKPLVCWEVNTRGL